MLQVSKGQNRLKYMLPSQLFLKGATGQLIVCKKERETFKRVFFSERSHHGRAPDIDRNSARPGDPAAAADRVT